METRPYRIAIVGSYAPDRKDELDLKKVDEAPQAGEELGRALANEGFHIIGYASYPHLLEVDVIRGYTNVQENAPNCIEVMFSRASGQPKFKEMKPDDPRFLFLPDVNVNWEMSFYQSIADIDGMILLGGGRSALIAGIVALGHKKPVWVCAAFGGQSVKVWDALANEKNPELKDAVKQMGNEWSPNSANRVVAFLKSQIQQAEKQKSDEARIERERIEAPWREKEHQESLVVRHAIAAFVLFVFGFAMWPIGWGNSLSGYTILLTVLGLAAAFSGASGASIRKVYDNATGAHAKKSQPWVVTAILGFGAGIISVLLFILAQSFANPTNIDPSIQPEQFRRVIPFAIAIGFVAGFTLERVFSRLIDVNVLRTKPIDADQPLEG